jgi:hypothetical protein
MKLSILALALCIGLLIWNAWLQIQYDHLSHAGSRPISLKLTSLEIVDADGNTVVEIRGAKDKAEITVQDSRGGKTEILGGKILVAEKQANELATLASNSLQLAALTNDKFPNAVLKNNTGTGILLLRGGLDQSDSLLATPTNITYEGPWTPGTDITSVPRWTVDTNIVTKDDLHNDALIDVDSKNFGAAKSDEGTFLISCQGVEPYLEGYKVHLQIGNPTMLVVNNPKLTVEWGSAFEKSAKTDLDNGVKETDWFADWKKSFRQTTTTLNESLKPGYWNDVEVIVSPAKADELAHFKVSIQTDSVSLTHPPDQH